MHILCLLNLGSYLPVGDENLLYYREKQMWKHLASNVFKGLFLLGTGTMLTATLSAVPELTTLGSGSAVAAEVQGPMPMLGPEENPFAASGSFTEPAKGVLTSAFGSRWGRQHTGIDIGGDAGSDILASDSGRVVYAGWVDGYGNYVVVDHENGFQTAYAHCDSLVVSEGECVTQGQKIAYMGSTGNSTGPHLHFEVKKDGQYQDPLDYVLY